MTLYRVIRQLDDAWLAAREQPTKELREREFWRTLLKSAKVGAPDQLGTAPYSSIHMTKDKNVTLYVPLKDQWVRFQITPTGCKSIDRRSPWPASLIKYGFSMVSFYIQIYLTLEGYNPLSPKPSVELPVYIRDCKPEVYLEHCEYIRTVTAHDYDYTYTVFKQFHHLWKTKRALSLYTAALERIGNILQEIVLGMNIEDASDAAVTLQQLVRAYESDKELLGIDRTFQLNKRIMKILDGSSDNVLVMWDYIFTICIKYVDVRVWPYVVTVLDFVTKWLSGIFPIITRVVHPNGQDFISHDWLPAPESSQVLYHKLYPTLSIRLSRNSSGKVTKSRVYMRGDIGMRFLDPTDAFYTGIITR